MIDTSGSAPPGGRLSGWMPGTPSDTGAVGFEVVPATGRLVCEADVALRPGFVTVDVWETDGVGVEYPETATTGDELEGDGAPLVPMEPAPLPAGTVDAPDPPCKFGFAAPPGC